MHHLIRYSLILFVCLLASDVWAAPKLVVEQPNFDFGEVLQGQIVHHTFSFSNGGNDLLQIKRVISSSGYTVALVSAKRLAPSENGKVLAKFDSTRFHGAVIKTISLYSNDPIQPVMNLYIKGNIRIPLSVEPSRINLEQITIGETATTKLILENHGEADLRLDEIWTSSPDLALVLPAETLSAGQSATIEVQLTPGSGQERFSGYIVIPAKGPLKSALRIPVHAAIQRRQNKE